MRKSHKWTYRLERLYEDQDPDFVIEAIAPLVLWLDPQDRENSHRFGLRQNSPGGPIEHELTLSWDMQLLLHRDPRLAEDLRRLRAGKTLHVERHTEDAALGLAMVAISCMLEGRRVVSVRRFNPPDLLIDTTLGALRGVEVAGRSTKGYPAFDQAIEGAGAKPGKRAQLRARAEVAEAYLSLWCCAPKVSIWEKVKP